MAGTPNETLAWAMGVTGFAPDRLAARVNRVLGPTRRNRWVTPSAVYKWRDHNRVPRVPLPAIVAGVLAEALGEPLTADQLWQGRAAAGDLWQPADFGLDLPWTPAGTVELLRIVRSDRVERREFLSIAGLPLLTPALEWANAEPAELAAATKGGRVSGVLLATIETRVRAIRRLDDNGGGHVLLLAETEFALVAELLRNGSYDTPVSQRLHVALAELAQLAGWACYDMADHGRAQRHYLTALRAAHTAHDWQLGARVLSCLAYQAAARGRAQEAVTLAECAQRGLRGKSTATIRSLLAATEARAHAVAGDGAAFGGALNRAERELEHARTEDDPPWSYWHDAANLAIDSGSDFGRLGQLHAAERRLQEGFAATAGFLRNRAVYLPDLADVQVRQGDVDAACASAAEAFRLGTELGSARALNGVRSFRAEVARHTGVSAVNDFLDATAALVAA